MKVKKSKFLSLLICLAVVLTYSIPVFADGSVKDSGSCGDNAKWTLYEDGILRVSGSGEMKDYTTSDSGSENSAPWLKYASSIQKVIISDEITSVGGYAFYGCALSSLTIGNSVKTIGENAFNKCANLRKFTIPSNVTQVYSNAFTGIATGLNGGTVTVEGTSTGFDYTAFTKGDRRGTLTIVCDPSSAARQYVENNTNFDLAWTCITHDWNTDLEDDNNAAVGSWGTKSIHCKDCSAHKEGTEEAVVPYKDWSYSGVDKDNNLKWYIYDGALVVEPYSGTAAIMNCSDGITKTPWNGHEDDVTKLVLKKGITAIGGRAFASYANLQSISLPEGLTAIGDAAFTECAKLEKVQFPEGLETIGQKAFYKCKTLGDVTIPKSVTKVGDQAFEYITSMKNVYIEGDATEFGTNVFLRDASQVEKYGKLTVVATKDSKAYTLAEENKDYLTFRCTDGTHTWSEYTVDKEPTCTENGSQSKRCTVCGIVDESSVQEIPATGHSWKHVKNAAGYLKNGTEYDICTVCNAKKNTKTLAGYSKYVVKKFKVKKGKKSFTATWKKASKANQKLMTGYQIRYSKKSNMSGAKYAAASKSSKSKKIKKLSKKKKYYVQVRTYMKKGGVTYYSKWSGKKTVKTK